MTFGPRGGRKFLVSFRHGQLRQNGQDWKGRMEGNVDRRKEFDGFYSVLELRLGST